VSRSLRRIPLTAPSTPLDRTPGRRMPADTLNYDCCPGLILHRELRKNTPLSAAELRISDAGQVPPGPIARMMAAIMRSAHKANCFSLNFDLHSRGRRSEKWEPSF
jgi:hypothetical protein